MPKEVSMSASFAVEADRRVVGVAVRVPGGFKFFFSDPDYLALEGKFFARARGLVRRVVDIARRKRSAAIARRARKRRYRAGR